MEMAVVELIMGILLLVLSLGLVVAVMLQSGKDKKLSGAIAGGADSFYCLTCTVATGQVTHHLPGACPNAG